MFHKLKAYLKLIRVKHYLKNGLIFLPVIFSGAFFNLDLVLKLVMGFFAFSFTASIVYIINDIQDIEKDKLHEVKKHRPLAAGIVTKKEAIILIFVLLFGIIILNYYIANMLLTWGILLLYFLLNFAYSMGLKNIPLVDIAILVSGFVLRVLYGAFIIDIEVSNWLYLTIISFSFYLGLGKRRNELLQEGNKTRKVLQYYNHNFLDKNMYMCMALGIVFYSLWCIDPINNMATGMNYLLITVPIVMLIVMKYSLDIEGNSYGDPVDVVTSDKVLMVMIAVYGIIILSILYLVPRLI